LARTCARKSPFQLHPSKHWLQSSWSCRSSSLRQLPQSSAWHNWDLFLQEQNQFVTSLCGTYSEWYVDFNIVNIIKVIATYNILTFSESDLPDGSRPSISFNYLTALNVLW
jgi:hypothetical protein